MPETDVVLDFDKQWNYGDPAASEAAFRKHLPEAEKNAGSSYHLQLLTQIARAQGLQRKFDDAHATLDSVEKRLDNSEPVVKVRYLLERGRVLNSSGKADEAKPLFLQAWETGQAAAEDDYAVDAAHMLGIVTTGEDALAWNLKALKLAEQSKSPRARNWLGSLYNNIGWTYHDRGQYDRALDLFEKALAFRQKKKQDNEIRIARWCVGRALRSLKRTDEALAVQQKLLAEWNKIGQQDGYVYEELGECLLELDRADEAKPWFAKAYGELSKDDWLKENEAERLTRLKRLGGL